MSVENLLEPIKTSEGTVRGISNKIMKKEYLKLKSYEDHEHTELLLNNVSRSAEDYGYSFRCFSENHPHYLEGEDFIVSQLNILAERKVNYLKNIKDLKKYGISTSEYPSEINYLDICN